MEVMKLHRAGNVVAWERAGHYLMGCMGRMERPLTEIDKLPGCEMAYAVAEGGATLNAFHHKPPINITLGRDDNKNANIVAHGMNIEQTRKLVDSLTSQSGLVLYKPRSDFIETLANGLISYKGPICPNAPQWINDYLEDHFATLQYATFLTNCRDIPPEKSIHIAANMFNVVLPRTREN